MHGQTDGCLKHSGEHLDFVNRPFHAAAQWDAGPIFCKIMKLTHHFKMSIDILRQAYFHNDYEKGHSFKTEH